MTVSLLSSSAEDLGKPDFSDCFLLNSWLLTHICLCVYFANPSSPLQSSSGKTQLPRGSVFSPLEQGVVPSFASQGPRSPFLWI